MSNQIYTLDEIAGIIAPIAARYGVDRIFIFGSYARGEADENSDIDLCIEAVAIKGLFALGGLYADLEEALGKERSSTRDSSGPNARLSGNPPELYRSHPA